MDEFSDSTAFLLVLEFLQTFNNGNRISVNEANTYIGENCQGYVKMMTIPIEKFLRKCEEKKILEKVAGASMKVTYKINDVEELQKCIRQLTLDEQKITSRKNEPVMKEERKTKRNEIVRIEKEKSKKKQDRGKQASKREDLREENICASKEDKEVNYSNTGTRTKILKAISIRPMIPKIVLDFLTASKDSNGVSLDKINSYIGEKYQVFVKVLKTSIKTFVTKCEENGILEKVIGANKEVLYKIKDEKEVQKRMHDLLLEEEKLASKKNEPVTKEYRKNRRCKRTPIEMDISEKNEDREKQVSNSDGKANFCKNMKSYALHPFISRIISETLTDLKKRNGTSLIEISSYIDKYNEARMEILKERFYLCTSNEDKKIIYYQPATRTTILKEVSVRPLHPLVSKLVIESRNVFSEFNGASIYEISNYNYDAVEFKTKDVVKPEKCTLGSMKEKPEFVRNAVVQKSKERNRGIGSKEDMRKMNSDAGKLHPLHPLVSKLVMESRNILSEFNGASTYEISNYNYDAVEFKIKDVVKPEKCTLGSMKEKAEFVRNAVVQKSKERNRGIGSKEDMRKMNGDAGKCILKRKRMGEDSEANKSNDAYMAKKKKLIFVMQNFG